MSPEAGQAEWVGEEEVNSRNFQEVAGRPGDFLGADDGAVEAVPAFLIWGWV